MVVPIPAGDTWVWPDLVPGYETRFLIQALALGGQVIKSTEFPFLLRDGKNYIFDWARGIGGEMTEGAAPPLVGITFQVGVTGTPDGWAGYDRWMIAYYDPGIAAFVSDQQWHNINDYVTFSGVQADGYLAGWVLRTSDPSVCSPQYTSVQLHILDNHRYLYNIKMLYTYDLGTI